MAVSIGVLFTLKKTEGIKMIAVEPDMFYVWYYPAIILAKAVSEETVYRLIPLSGVVWTSYLWLKYVAKRESRRIVMSAAIAVAIPASAYFGYTHGDWRNIFVQGFGGGVFSYIFLKYGGLDGRFMAPLISSTFCHALYNMVVFTPYVAAHFLGS